VSIGRLHPAKGFPVLLAAVRLLAASGLTPPVTIVGEGAERERLKDLGADLPHVRFAGSIPHERIPDLLSTATLFVLPSVDRDGQREGTPSVLMEAMAGGLPIVTTDSGGAADLVRHRLNGLVVPQHSPAALAEALRELLQDETARGLIGERNRRKAAEKDWSVIESQVAAVYETALRQYTRRPPPLLP
jgi:glycosyltransferase involved in cell wall biosynthesis